MLTGGTHKLTVCSTVSDGCDYLLGKADFCAVRICHRLIDGLSKALFDVPNVFDGWLQAEAIIGREPGPVGQTIFHTWFLLVSSLLWDCAVWGQASKCNFAGVIQLNNELSCWENLYSSFIKCQPVSEVEPVRQKLLLWAVWEFPLEKSFQHSLMPVRKLLLCQVLLIVVQDRDEEKKPMFLLKPDFFVTSLLLINKKIWFPL